MKLTTVRLPPFEAVVEYIVALVLCGYGMVWVWYGVGMV